MDCEHDIGWMRMFPTFGVGVVEEYFDHIDVLSSWKGVASNTHT